MNLKIVETGCIRLKGLSKPFSGSAADRFEQEHVMWADECDDCPRRICGRIPGVWYGVWDKGRYSVAKMENEIDFDGLETIEIPGGTYAVFTTGLGGFAGDELPRLRDQIFSSWLPDSGYEQAYDYEVEVYHLFSKGEKQKRHYEMWIPLRKTSGARNCDAR